MVDLILVFTFMIGYLSYLLTCCNRLLQRHHSFQGWDRSSSTRPLVEDAQTIDLCMIERGYHVFRLAFSSFPVQCAYCTRRCIQLPNLRLPPALVLIVYLKWKKDFCKMWWKKIYHTICVYGRIGNWKKAFANLIKHLYLDHPEFLVSNERLDRPFGTRRREATEEVLLVVLEAQEPQLVHFLPLVQHDLMYL